MAVFPLMRPTLSQPADSAIFMVKIKEKIKITTSDPAFSVARPKHFVSLVLLVLSDTSLIVSASILLYRRVPPIILRVPVEMM